MTNRYSDYDDFAWFYNQEFTAYSENIFPILKDIVRDKLPDGAVILDLCCGTGQLVKTLLEKGYNVTGIDGSAEMLRYAKINAPGAEFINEDARTFKLPPKYDAVFSTFDSLNHIMKATELLRTFKNVYRCLVNGGFFVFDMNTEKTFEKGWIASKQIIEIPGYFYASSGDYDKKKRIAQFHITIFSQKAEVWQRSDVLLQETFYPGAVIKSLLKRAGFTTIKMYSFSRERGLCKPDRGSYRIFYYALKP